MIRRPIMIYEVNIVEYLPTVHQTWTVLSKPVYSSDWYRSPGQHSGNVLRSDSLDVKGATALLVERHDKSFTLSPRSYYVVRYSLQYTIFPFPVRCK